MSNPGAVLYLRGVREDQWPGKPPASALVGSRMLAGFPLRLPSLDVNSVGAGGGSIAWIDRDGLLKVGPQSAGAVPGPACYNVGGTEATDDLKRELREHVAKEIGALARPDSIRFTESLPKTRSGKIMRRLLRDIAAGRESTGDTTTLEDYSALAKLREEEG